MLTFFLLSIDSHHFYLPSSLPTRSSFFLPFKKNGSFTPANAAYLTTEQVLADYVDIIVHLKVRGEKEEAYLRCVVRARVCVYIWYKAVCVLECVILVSRREIGQLFVCYC